MSTGPFNLVVGDGNNLVFSLTDNWVVDQEVPAGGSATWKVTPAFDTTLFDIPGDIAIWYSVGGGAFAESTEPDHSLTVEITSNTTVIAKMAYSGTGADITSSTGTNLTTTTQQSVNLTAGSSTTIGTVTVTGSAAPTEGVAESYSAAFDGDATDATYLWTTTDGSATIATPTAATTDITFSTSGSFTVTCTVSSATASDSPASDALAVTVAAAGPDWDTNHSGVFQITSTGFGNTVPLIIEITSASVGGNIDDATFMGPIGGYFAVLSYSSAQQGPVYYAVWDDSAQQWSVRYNSWSVNSTGQRLTTVNEGTDGWAVGDIVVQYENDPGTFASWRNYDGPYTP